MVKIPDTIGSQRLVPTPQRTVQGYDLSPLKRSNDAVTAAGQQLGASAQDFAASVQKSDDRDSILDAQARENNAKRAAMDYLYGQGETPGLYASEGKDALGAGKKFTDQFKSIREKALDGMENPRAVRALESSLADIELSHSENVARFEAGQRKSYSTELASSRAALDDQRVGLEYNNDKTFDKAVLDKTASIEAQSKIKGLSSEGTQLAVGQATSDLYKTRLAAMMNTSDPNRIAQAGVLYDKAVAQGKISFQDQMGLSQLIKVAVPKAQAQIAFQKDHTDAAVNQPTSDTLVLAMQSAESGGKQTGGPGSVAGPNEPTTSKAGAIGIMQVLPATAKETAAAHNIPWDETKFRSDPDYNTKIGHAYLEDQLAKYGDTRLAVAAYNMGPGATDALIKKVGDPRKGEVSYEDFLAKAPAETRNYVAKVVGNAQSIYGPPTLDIFKAKDVAAKMPPDVADHYLSLVTSHNNQVTEATKQDKNDAIGAIQPILEQAGGDINAVPPSLLAKAAKAGVLEDLRNYKGFTDTSFKNYLDTLDTDKFSAVDLSDPAVRLRLSASDYQDYVKKQSDMVADPKNAAMSRRVDDAVNYVFQSDLGYTAGDFDVSKDKNTSKGPTGAVMQQKVLRLKALVQAGIQDEYARTGKVPSAADVHKMADSIVVNDVSAANRSKWVGGWAGDAIDYMTGGNKVKALDVGVSDIDPDLRKKIEAARTARNLPVTESGVVADYLMILKNQELHK